MLARDVMTTSIVTVRPETEVSDIAALLLEHRISAVPVIDGDARVLGIVSEGDLINRPEGATRHRTSWWLELLRGTQDQTRDYLKTHGRRAEDVMTPEVVSVAEDTPIAEIAKLLEKHGVKRVPVLRDAKIVGIVSRADLLRGLAAASRPQPAAQNDGEIRDAMHRALSEAGLGTHLISVTVKEGEVELSGRIDSEVQRRAARAAAEATPGVRRVQDNLLIADAPVSAGRGYV